MSSRWSPAAALLGHLLSCLWLFLSLHVTSLDQLQVKPLSLRQHLPQQRGLVCLLILWPLLQAVRFITQETAAVSFQLFWSPGGGVTPCCSSLPRWYRWQIVVKSFGTWNKLVEVFSKSHHRVYSSWVATGGLTESHSGKRQLVSAALCLQHDGQTENRFCQKQNTSC